MIENTRDQSDVTPVADVREQIRRHLEVANRELQAAQAHVYAPTYDGIEAGRRVRLFKYGIPALSIWDRMTLNAAQSKTMTVLRALSKGTG